MSSRPETEVLIERAAAGDSAALDSLIVEHLPELRGFVNRRLGPAVRAREAVSDVVQSTCREVLTHRERFRFGETDSFRRWLLSTALRKIMNKKRFHLANRRDGHREAGSVTPIATQQTPSPSQAALDSELLEHLQETLARLPEEHRRVVILSHIAELSRSEVARVMGRSEASVRNLLHRTLAQLGAHLARSSGGSEEIL